MDIDLSKVDNIQKDIWVYIKKHYVSHIIFPILAIILAAFIDYLGGYVAGFSMIVVIIIVFRYINLYSKIQQESFYKKFALKIGFSYSENAPIGSVSGYLFNLGHDRIISNVMTGIYKNIPLRIFLYQYTIGYDRNETAYYCTIFEVTLKNDIPDMSLNSTNNFLFTDFKEESLKLESDEFNRNFELHVLKNHEQEAYQIFTPDVMTDLIDKAKNLNFEFNQNKLYIYTPKSLAINSDLQSGLNLTDYLLDIFKNNISSVSS